MDFTDFRRKLNGKIEIEPPNKFFNRFYGFLKLKNDTQSEQLSYINFIPRGSKILNNWLENKYMAWSTFAICKMIAPANAFDSKLEKTQIFLSGGSGVSTWVRFINPT